MALLCLLAPKSHNAFTDTYKCRFSQNKFPYMANKYICLPRHIFVFYGINQPFIGHIRFLRYTNSSSMAYIHLLWHMSALYGTYLPLKTRTSPFTAQFHILQCISASYGAYPKILPTMANKIENPYNGTCLNNGTNSQILPTMRKGNKSFLCWRIHLLPKFQYPPYNGRNRGIPYNGTYVARKMAQIPRYSGQQWKTKKLPILTQFPNYSKKVEINNITYIDTYICCQKKVQIPKHSQEQRELTISPYRKYICFPNSDISLFCPNDDRTSKNDQQ